MDNFSVIMETLSADALPNDHVDHFGMFIPTDDEATTKTTNWMSDGKLSLDDADLIPLDEEPPPPAPAPPLPPLPLPAPGPPP